MIAGMTLLVLGLGLMAPAAVAAPTLERVVIVQRHGVRPPTASNAALAAYAGRPWPNWPVAAGELTPHGGETVALMASTLGQTYRDAGLLSAQGCPPSEWVTVWADGATERTRRSGEILAKALAPGCGLKAAWAPASARDPIFEGAGDAPACRPEPGAELKALLAAIGPTGVDTPATRSALKHLQAILAPDACAGGHGTCFSGEDKVIAGPGEPELEGPLVVAASLAEDLLMEYAEGMPAADVGWGRAATAADIAAVMPLNERAMKLYTDDTYLAARDGAPMARLILAALAGEPSRDDVGSGPQTRLLVLVGHDSNLALMGALFGLEWTLPGEPDRTAPAATLAFELWQDGSSGARFVRPVIYYETLDQLRSLNPATAKRMELTLSGCASGPMGSCPLAELSRRALAAIPADCGRI